ncbi:MAG: hypothetical protein LUM44_04250 [Pyrinomonadaceae bacterium]|nr:hypothetical protein [Pyrinomonadaceae bacterium]
MKWKLLIVTAIFILSSQIVFAQTEKQITAIRAKVAAINKGAKNYTKKNKDVEDISLEGTEATFYSSRLSLKKVTANMYGETYKATGEFYYENGKLIFAFVKHNQYDTQIGMAKAPKVVRVEERRYYFGDDGLIRLLVGKKELKAGDENYDELKDSAISIGEKFQEAFRQK